MRVRCDFLRGGEKNAAAFPCLWVVGPTCQRGVDQWNRHGGTRVTGQMRRDARWAVRLRSALRFGGRGPRPTLTRGERRQIRDSGEGGGAGAGETANAPPVREEMREGERDGVRGGDSPAATGAR